MIWGDYRIRDIVCMSEDSGNHAASVMSVTGCEVYEVGNTYGGFFRIVYGGICVIERGLWYEEKDMSEGREDYGMGGVQHRVTPRSM